MAAAVTVGGEQTPAATTQTPAMTRQIVSVRHYPPGYRFLPTDAEIIYYLNLKIKNDPIPTDKIAEVNIYHYNPRTLAETYPQLGMGRNDSYFFSPRDRKYPNGKRPSRKAGNGYWKATGADKSITDHENTVVGFKKSLVYYEGKPPKGTKTNWIMHEFRSNQPQRNKRNAQDMRLDDWVLCRIHENTPCNRNQAVDDYNQIVQIPDEVRNNNNVTTDQELNSNSYFMRMSQADHSFGSSTGAQLVDTSCNYLMTDEDSMLYSTLCTQLTDDMYFSSCDLQTSFGYGDDLMNSFGAHFGPSSIASSDTLIEDTVFVKKK